MIHCAHEMTPFPKMTIYPETEEFSKCESCGQEMRKICACGCGKPYEVAVAELALAKNMDYFGARTIVSAKMAPYYPQVEVHAVKVVKIND